MKLYEIEQGILDCLDEETGEILNEEKLNALQMELQKKIEGVALWVKDTDALIEALENEKRNLDARLKSARTRRDGLKVWLQKACSGTKFETAKCKISFRKSKSVNVSDMNALLAFDVIGEYIKVAEPEARKSEIKKAIESGIKIPGCELVENTSTIIK